MATMDERFKDMTVVGCDYNDSNNCRLVEKAYAQGQIDALNKIIGEGHKEWCDEQFCRYCGCSPDGDGYADSCEDMCRDAIISYAKYLKAEAEADNG